MPTSISAIGQQDLLVNQAIPKAPQHHVTQAIKMASIKSGVDFSYLLNKASQESNFDPNAKATTSSATGLFQFTQQTWLHMIKSAGDKYGLGEYAKQITVDVNGVAKVNDPKMRQTILALRKDPAVSAEMAGELDKANYATLKNTVGGKIGPTELYLAHFLGAGGATDFIEAMRRNPKASAANILPEAAQANSSVFYTKAGMPKSVTQIYQQFAQKFDKAPAMPGDTVIASNKAPEPFTVADGSTAAMHGLPDAAKVLTASKANASGSLYAAMVLAQMDMHTDSSRMLGTSSHKDQKRGPASIMLGGIG